METFFYEAAAKDGSVITGTIEALNESTAVDRIHEQGYYPLKVSRESSRKPPLTDVLSYFQTRISDSDIVTFTYQLGVLLEAGFPLERALRVIADLTDKKSLKDLTNEVVSHVRGGKSFSEALNKFPAVFPLFYVNMIKAGEAGGFLEDTISRMSVYLENSQALRAEVRSALIYPAILLIFGTAAVLVLITFVVPKFSVIFAELGDALPLPTRILLGLSGILQSYWWALLVLAGSGVFLIRRYLKSEAGRAFWDNVRYRLPIFGKLFRETVVARFARTMGTLLGSGVPILNALQIVMGTVDSGRMTSTITLVKNDVRRGKGISESLRKSDIFPSIAVHMVTVGEETGRLDEMLLKIADRYEIEVRNTIRRMLSLLEPALIVLMAVLVGFIVIAMLMAIFSINELPF